MVAKYKTIIILLIKYLKSVLNFSNYEYKNCKPNKFLTYDKYIKIFLISDNNLDANEVAKIRKIITYDLRKIIPQSYIRIDDIITGYYDQCLERYLFERLDRNYDNENTCWLKYAQNNKCIGWQNEQGMFNNTMKEKFIDDFSNIHPNKFINKNLVNSLFKDDEGYVYNLTNNQNKDDDKILSLLSKIKKYGFSNIISSFSESPIILDYSRITKKYNVTSGRHRIAVLRYLRSQEKIKNIKVRCHIIKHSFKSLTYTRPYIKSCKQCNWGEIYDPSGTGRHQDYLFREGIAIMRGHPRKKGGRQKWDRIKPVFKKYVQNKSVLDIGAHLGLYCLKALENGSSKATALDTSEDHVNNLSRLKKHYCLDDLLVLHGDFYDKNVYDQLCYIKYDTVFLFGIIHHLLRLGIQKNILTSYDELIKRISDITKYGVIIEFAMPREKDFLLPELKQQQTKFTMNEFNKALNNYFFEYQNLGRCHYVSGSKFGRFMFAASK